jgi:hypothetical protein
MVLLVWMAATQAAEIHRLGLGTTRTGDSYSEADAIRSADYYARFGFLANVGLPVVTFGDRFPGQGSVADPNLPLSNGVYTRNPPLANWLCGIMATILGMEHIWAWRLLPVLLTLVATALLFLALEQSLGALEALAITVLVSAAPTTLAFMHNLHYQGYAHALMLLQLGLLTRAVFNTGITASQLAGLAGLGFLQGWLSFEYVFVVAGAAVPIAIAAREDGYGVRPRTLLALVAAPGLGFVAALTLHFAQVIAFHGSASAAVADFAGRASLRAFGEGATPYYELMPLVVARQLKVLFFGPAMVHFGSLLPLVTAGAVALTRWRKKIPALRHGRIVALVTAVAICALWAMVMPEHANAHPHYVPRLFFLAYFTAAMALVSAWKDLSRSSGRSEGLQRRNVASGE